MFYRFYDALFASKDYTGEIERALALAEIRTGVARILEIGAGTGNHTIACAKLCHYMVGVEIDISHPLALFREPQNADRRIVDIAESGGS